MATKSKLFTRFAKRAAHFTGTPACFIVAIAIIAAWACTGPVFKFNDTWQLVINTGTTIITFLMVFLIQNTQYRDTEAMQIKLDELLRSHRPANNALLDLEELEEEDLEDLRKSYEALAQRSRDKRDAGKRGHHKRNA
jgi:low affinity Fe/Cu permease